MLVSRAQTLFFAILLLAGCSRHPGAPDAAAQSPVAVRTAVVVRSTEPRLQPVAGTVRPIDHAVIAAKVMGTVATADVAVGQRVQSGEVLVTLTANEIVARVEQARAALNEATRDHGREASLLEKGAATAETVRSLADRQQAAAAVLDETEAMLAYTRIAAPFAGVITRDLVNVGDLAIPGQPLLELEAVDRLRAEVQVPESLPMPRPGATLVIELETTRVRGVLTEVSPAADRATRTRLARIELPAHAPARSGQFVRILWPADPVDDLTVPESAISMFGQMERVFVVHEGHARLRLVKTGARHGDRIVLLSGAAAGEVVALDPPPSLRDGISVEIAP